MGTKVIGRDTIVFICSHHRRFDTVRSPCVEALDIGVGSRRMVPARSRMLVRGGILSFCNFAASPLRSHPTILLAVELPYELGLVDGWVIWLNVGAQIVAVDRPETSVGWSLASLAGLANGSHRFWRKLVLSAGCIVFLEMPILPVQNCLQFPCFLTTCDVV